MLGESYGIPRLHYKGQQDNFYIMVSLLTLLRFMCNLKTIPPTDLRPLLAKDVKGTLEPHAIPGNAHFPVILADHGHFGAQPVGCMEPEASAPV
eukprot:1155981-Pelagomonas_calceolata.AAC.2